jgi:high-affinity iron transporter
MKSVFKKLAGIVFATLLLAGPAWGAPEGAQKAAALLDYIAADYGGAVANGAVVSQFEYDEQLEFLGAVRKLLADVAPPAAVAGGLDRLEAAMKDKQGADVVSPLALEVRRGILGHYQIVQSPERAPDAARGAKIFRETCASCHAADGSGQTPVAATFEVKPPDFRDPEGALARSPFRAYNTVTFGVEGTPMPGFGQLSDAQRWDVAFYVTTLAHGGPKPEAAAPALPAGFDASLPALAAQNDDELKARGAAQHLAWLRATAPYVAKVDAAGGVAEVRRHLDRVRQGLAANDFQAARLAALDAYLEGFEPIEARVSAMDHDLVIETEQLFGKMRAAIERGDAAGATAALTEVDGVLGRVETRLAGQGSASSTTLFVASAVILLREGLEVVLLIGLMLALLGRMGRDDAKRWVHRGWMAALAAGGLTWVAATFLVQVSGRSREVLEGVVALVAAVVLLFVSHWFLSAAEKQRWLALIKEKVAGHLNEGRVLPLFGIAFLAVYREAFETVLFYQALLLDSPGGGMPILGGLVAGLAGVAVFGFLILRAGRKLPLGPLFTVSGLILCALCVVFVGQGLAALREAGVMSPRPVDLPTVSWLGLYPDLLGLGAQAAMVAVIVGLVYVPRLLARRNAAAT